MFDTTVWYVYAVSVAVVWSAVAAWSYRHLWSARNPAPRTVPVRARYRSRGRW